MKAICMLPFAHFIISWILFVFAELQFDIIGIYCNVRSFSQNRYSQESRITLITRIYLNAHSLPLTSADFLCPDDGSQLYSRMRRIEIKLQASGSRICHQPGCHSVPRTWFESHRSHSKCSEFGRHARTPSFKKKRPLALLDWSLNAPDGTVSALLRSCHPPRNRDVLHVSVDEYLGLLRTTHGRNHRHENRYSSCQDLLYGMHW